MYEWLEKKHDKKKYVLLGTSCHLGGPLKTDVKTCEALGLAIIRQWPKLRIWANYNDFSRGHLKWWFSKGIPPKSP